jgi:invasion protein IalB
MQAVKWLLAGFLFVVMQVQAAEPEKFGDWTKKCEKDSSGLEICYIEQVASDKKTGQRIMLLKIGYVPSRTKEPIMIVTVPLGVAIKPGVAYFMDNQQLVSLSLLVCEPDGCSTSGQPVPVDIVDMMRKGKTGEIRIMLLNREVVALPVSLKGITKALNAIEPK